MPHIVAPDRREGAWEAWCRPDIEIVSSVGKASKQRGSRSGVAKLELNANPPIRMVTRYRES